MVIAKNGELRTKTGRAATFVVAASNSVQKDEADYICNGTDDQVEIQAAIDALPVNGGKVMLLDGTYDITSHITVGINVTLQGSGRGSIIKLNKINDLGVGDSLLYVRGICEDLCLNGNAWSDQDIDTNGVYLYDYSILRNCEIKEVRQYAIVSYNTVGSKIFNNRIHHTKYPISMKGNPGDGSSFSYGWQVMGNICYEFDHYVKLVRTKEGMFSNNVILKTIEAASGLIVHGGDDGGSYGLSITNNIFLDDVGTGATTGIELIADPEEISRDILVSGNLVRGFHVGIRSAIDGSIIQSNTCVSSRFVGIEIRRTANNSVIGNKTDCGIIIDGSSHSSVFENTISGAVPYSRGDNSGIFVWGEYGSANNTIIENNKIYDCLGHGVYLSDEIQNVENTVIQNNSFHSLGGNAIKKTSAGKVTYFEICHDYFINVLAISSAYIRLNEDLSAATPITFTLDAQPDIPRTLSARFNTHTNITEYDIEIIGVDAKGNIVTETKDETDGWDWETSNAFATITSIKMTARTGTGVGDTMDIGITDVLGLSNVFYDTGDVFKIKKNNANAVVAGAQVNTTYHTYDMSVIGLAATDDFTIWYRSNLNILS